MKSPKQDATVTAFYTYWNGPNWSVGEWNELYIEIAPSVQTNLNMSPMSTNLIYGVGDDHYTY